MIFFSRIIIIFIAMESMQHFIVIVLNSPNCTSPLTKHIHLTATDSALVWRTHQPDLSCKLLPGRVFLKPVLSRAASDSRHNAISYLNSHQTGPQVLFLISTRPILIVHTVLMKYNTLTYT